MNGFAEEGQGCCGIPSGSQQEIDCLPRHIHDPVQIFPLARDPDVRFVHSPPTSGLTFISPENFILERNQTENPPVERGMVNNNSALRHYLFQFSQAQGIRQIPANTVCDKINGIMQAGEDFSAQRYRHITSCKSRLVPDASLKRRSPLL